MTNVQPIAGRRHEFETKGRLFFHARSRTNERQMQWNSFFPESIETMLGEAFPAADRDQTFSILKLTWRSSKRAYADQM